jgi:hypothetical protein
LVFIFLLYVCVMIFIDFKKCRSLANKFKAFSALGSILFVVKFSKNLFVIFSALIIGWAILVDRNKKGKMSIFIGNIITYITMGYIIFSLSPSDFRPLVVVPVILFVITLCAFAGLIGETVTDKLKKWTGQKSTSQILQK